MYSIYGIKRQTNTSIYYIGRTKDIGQRKRQHKYLGRTGLFITLATCEDKADAIVIERHYIAKYRDSIENSRERYYTGVSASSIILNR